MRSVLFPMSTFLDSSVAAGQGAFTVKFTVFKAAVVGRQQIHLFFPMQFVQVFGRSNIGQGWNAQELCRVSAVVVAHKAAAMVNMLNSFLTVVAPFRLMMCAAYYLVIYKFCLKNYRTKFHNLKIKSLWDNEKTAPNDKKRSNFSEQYQASSGRKKVTQGLLFFTVPLFLLHLCQVRSNN